MRVRRQLGKLMWPLGAAIAVVATLPSAASGQIVEITPSPTDPISSTLSPGTQWVYWMAIGAGVLGLLIVVGIAAGYLRFAPKFFGRQEGPGRPPPGVRPESLTRQAASMRHAPTPPTAAAPPPAPAAAAPAAPVTASAASTATAVAERPGPVPADDPESGTTEGEAVAAEATVRLTASAGAESAVQADAVGEAEAAAPEPAPTARAAAPAVRSGGATEMDQETFDRVLQEQLDRGVDRRVAEGRARAAGIVAARKKAQS